MIELLVYLGFALFFVAAMALFYGMLFLLGVLFQVWDDKVHKKRRKV